MCVRIDQQRALADSLVAVFVTEHINGGSSKVPTPEGIHQGLLFQDFTARGIDQNGSTRQKRQLFPADNLDRVLGERNMKAYNLTLA